MTGQPERPDSQATMLMRRTARTRRRLQTSQAVAEDAVLPALLDTAKAHQVLYLVADLDDDRPVGAAYLRVSQDSEEDAHGVANQWAELLAMFRAQGVQVGAVYLDNDVSAFKDVRRHSYDQLLQDGAAGQFNVVGYWAQDRLIRKPADLRELAQLNLAHGVTYLGCRSGRLDLRMPSDRLTATILASVGEYESAHKSERTRMAKHHSKAKGEWLGGAAPYGYRSTRRADGMLTLEPVEHEAAVLRRVADDLTLDRRSANGVARALTAEGVPTPGGGQRWYAGGVLKLVRNPAVAGLREVDGGYEPATWPPIISASTWRKVKRLTTAEWKDRRAPNRSNLLTGLVYGPAGDRGRAGCLPDRQRCYIVKGATMPAEPLERYVVQAVRTHLTTCEMPALTTTPSPTPTKAEGQVAELREKLGRAAQRVANGQMAEEAYEALADALGAALADAKRSMAKELKTATRNGQAPTRTAMDAVRRMRAAAQLKDKAEGERRMDAVWEELSLEQQRDTIELFVDRIIIRSRWTPAPERVQIVWRGWPS